MSEIKGETARATECKRSAGIGRGRVVAVVVAVVLVVAALNAVNLQANVVPQSSSADVALSAREICRPKTVPESSMSPPARSELDDVEAWRSFTQRHSRSEGLGPSHLAELGEAQTKVLSCRIAHTARS